MSVVGRQNIPHAVVLTLGNKVILYILLYCVVLVLVVVP